MLSSKVLFIISDTHFLNFKKHRPCKSKFCNTIPGDETIVCIYTSRFTYQDPYEQKPSFCQYLEYFPTHLVSCPWSTALCKSHHKPKLALHDKNDTLFMSSIEFLHSYAISKHICANICVQCIDLQNIPKVKVCQILLISQNIELQATHRFEVHYIDQRSAHKMYIDL